MHCGIASLGTKTPAIFLDYQDKTKGIEELFNLDLSVRIEQDIENSIQQALLLFYKLNNSSTREKIAKQLEKVVELSSHNLPANLL
jgi:polysaccharide pyruvyl transferase WcaK-like protein